MVQGSQLVNKVSAIMEQLDFSGIVLFRKNGETLLNLTRGHAQRSDELPIMPDTRFGIASGCKIFTAVAIGQLVEQGKLTYESRLSEVLDIDFPLWDESITVHQLLTHTAGIPDYFDEEEMHDFASLWKERPVYAMREPSDFLPMFQNLPMKFAPGERFHYNNAGYIVLGLIIEQQSGTSFAEYVEEHVFRRCQMEDSGYFEADRLPRNTATGYVDHEDGTWTSNVFSIPVKGGADGGAYTTGPDMLRFWSALLNHELLSGEGTSQLLKPYSRQEDNEYYGRGVWIDLDGKEPFKMHVMGFDPGVSFMSAVYPQQNAQLVICSNRESGPYRISRAIEEEWDKE